MDYEVELLEVQAHPLAAVKQATDSAALGRTIIRLLDQVYAFLRDARAPVKQAGHNIVLYFDGGSTIEAGVEVSGAFENEGTVKATTTPSGRAAHTVHFGPYSGLPTAHKAARAWCAANRYALEEPCWEVYGDWDADETRLRTDVYYLLADERRS
jgi:effector-binding domain-containing protein